jgi:hypothetical protein
MNEIGGRAPWARPLSFVLGRAVGSPFELAYS